MIKNNLERILKVLSLVFEIEIDQLNKNSSINNIESWDSLNHIKLIIALEEEFNIDLTEEEIMEMDSLETIINTLDTKIK